MIETLKRDGARAKLYRDGPNWDGAPTAAIGSFKCDTAEAGAALLKDAQELITGEGTQCLLGPMDGDTWHSYRLVSESDDSAPFLMEPTSAPHDLAAFEAAGFAPIAQYFSARAPIPKAAAPELPDGITVTQWDGAAPEAHFAEVHTLSTRAFAGNLFYKPLDRDGFVAMYMPFVPLLQPELVLLARDPHGTLLGYLFAIPNYQAGPDAGEVILKTYASLRPGLGRALVQAFHAAASGAGFTTAIHALIQDDNRSADRSRREGGTIFRRYALMGWRASG